jgi:hypothetical protein
MATTPESPESLLALSDDEIYLGLGRELAGPVGVPQDLGAIVARGKQAFNELQAKLRPVVCGPDGPRAGCGTLTKVTLVNAIANAILTGNVAALSAGAVLYIAVLIVRLGLDRYCESYTGPVPSGRQEASPR